MKCVFRPIRGIRKASTMCRHCLGHGRLPILDAHEQPLNPIPEDGGERLRAILRFSALPGCSRHHWGADFDIFAPNLLPEKQSLQLTAKEYEQGSYFYELGQYLRANLSRFGFVRPYCPTKAKNSSSSVAFCPICGAVME